MQCGKEIIATGILLVCLISCVSALEITTYDRSFVGTEWSVTSFLSGSEMTSVLNDYPISMNFGPDGWAFGSAGCNQFSGAYGLEQDSNLLTIKPLRMTRMFCEQQAMDQETAFTEAALGVVSYYNGEVFTLNGAGGEAIIVLEPALEPESVPLIETTWNLVAYGLEYNVPPADVVPTIAFSDDGMLSGTSGCNSFFGQYQTDGQTMSIGQMGSTLMLCLDDGVVKLEDEYFALLQDVTAYVIDGTFLTLYNENAVGILFFETVSTAQIYNTPFELRSFSVDGGIHYVLTDSTITFEIAEDGTIAGNAGCNRYSAVATFDAAKVTIAPAISTMMLCTAEGVMEQESAYLAMLPSVDSFDFDGTYLKLYDANEEIIATYIKAT
jgi:heat shock protein HslJ